MCSAYRASKECSCYEGEGDPEGWKWPPCKEGPGSVRKANGVLVGFYAAQLAWWLSFFPPDRFLLVTSQELHDPDTALQVWQLRCSHIPAQLAFARS
jgi:hypothetical protein